ncbi:MAG: hypothetical protein SFV81_06180 [Pirellulaceae bacterium]|nr:hypothetical protein [Pirellulaceae bacterium]
MPTLVRHIPTQKLYIFLGPAYGMAKTNRSNLAMDTAYASFENKLLVVADASGEISWLPSFELLVESVGGRSCRVVLAEATNLKCGSPESA